MSWRDPLIAFAIEIPNEMLDYSEPMERCFLPEDVLDWLEDNCGAWQFFGSQTIWFEKEEDRLHFKMRWL